MSIDKYGNGNSQKESQQEPFKIEKIIKRGFNLAKIKKLLSYPNILAILEMRRSGKSVLSLLVLEYEKFGYINFFDERPCRLLDIAFVLQVREEKNQ